LADWIRTEGSRTHSLFAQLSDSNGLLDLPMGTTVSFVGVPQYTPQPTTPGQIVTPLPNIGGGGVVERPGATLDDPNRGFVRYDLTDADVSNQAVYRCTWYVTTPGQTNSQAFPEDGNMLLWIKAA